MNPRQVAVREMPHLLFEMAVSLSFFPLGDFGPSFFWCHQQGGGCGLVGRAGGTEAPRVGYSGGDREPPIPTGCGGGGESQSKATAR